MAMKRGFSKGDFVGSVQFTNPDTGQQLEPWRVTSFSGGSVSGSAKSNPDWDGGYVTGGRRERETVTITMAWGRNPAVNVIELDRWAMHAEAILTHSRARNGVIVGDTRRFTGLLTKVEPPEGDYGSDDGAVLQMEFAVDSDLLA